MEEQKGIGVDLSIASKEMIEALISESGEPSLFEEVLKANTRRHDILRLLAESPYTPENIREDAAKILQIPVEVSALPEETEQAAEQRTQTLLQKVQGLTVAEKEDACNERRARGKVNSNKRYKQADSHGGS